MTIAHRVELAFGADLTVNSGSWTYTDVSVYALGEAEVEFGRVNEASTTNPATFQIRLKNTDGRFTPRGTSSPTWPYMRRQTPVRYSINPGTGYTQVFQGFVDEISPTWPAGNSQYAEVSITASGALRRLSQGSPVLQSAIYRSTVAAHPQLYAPMEEESGATQFATQGSKTLVPVLRGGTVSFGGDSTLPGSARAAVLSSTSYLSLEASAGKYSGQWQFDWFMKFPAAPAVETIVMRAYTSVSGAFMVDAVYGGSTWGLRIYDNNGTSVGSATFGLPAGVNTDWWHWRIMAHDIGGTAEYVLVVFPYNLSGLGSFAVASVAGVSPGTPLGATVFPSAGMTGVAMCHWSVYDRYNLSAVDQSGDGYAGENAVSRLKRLNREEGLELTVTGTSTILMGPQRPAALMTLLRECEAADGGILYDGYTAGLSYLAESSRYNRTPTLALDVARHQVKLPFTPTEDDQHLANDWTVSSPAGMSAQFVDQAHVDAEGRYQNSASINVNSEGALLDAASWRAHLGTVDEMRVPQLSLQLCDRPELWSSVLALRPGFTATVDNLLTQYPPGPLGVVVEGYSATIDATSWQMSLNCSPSSPWNVGVFDSSNWLDCGASVLGTALPASAVGASASMDVLVSDSCNWTDADGDYSITVGGEEMTVTAVGATTTPTPALVAVGTAASSDGFGTRFVTPGLPGGATAAGNLLLMLASCRDTNAVDTDMYLTGAPGWRKILDGVNFAFFAKVHSGSEVAPTLRIPPFEVIVGDTLIAQIASFSGKWGDPKSQLIASASQFNVAAQDIAYPALPVGLGGVLLIWAGWKADDWTSVATLGGITEISEVPTTAGNDAGQVWDYNTSAGVPTVVGGSFVVTGGASQISRGVVFALRSVYQTLTVTRGANGITRAHALGEAVHVTDPLIFTRQ